MSNDDDDDFGEFETSTTINTKIVSTTTKSTSTTIKKPSSLLSTTAASSSLDFVSLSDEEFHSAVASAFGLNKNTNVTKTTNETEPTTTTQTDIDDNKAKEETKVEAIVEDEIIAPTTTTETKRISVAERMKMFEQPRQQRDAFADFADLTIASSSNNKTESVAAPTISLL